MGDGAFGGGAAEGGGGYHDGGKVIGDDDGGHGNQFTRAWGEGHRGFRRRPLFLPANDKNDLLFPLCVAGTCENTRMITFEPIGGLAAVTVQYRVSFGEGRQRL